MTARAAVTNEAMETPVPERNIWAPTDPSPEYMQLIRKELTEHYKANGVKPKDLKATVDRQIAHAFGLEKKS
jgi:hypothetical protein